MCSDAAGIARRESGYFGQQTLASDTGLDGRTVRVALAVLQRLRVAKSQRPGGRRAPAELVMNLGGLSWPAVRERVRESVEARAEGHPDLFGDAPTDRERGHGATIIGLVRRADVQIRRVDNGGTASGTYAVAAEKRGQQQQQDRDRERIDGLLAACAVRARALGRLGKYRAVRFDEGAWRRALADGSATVDDLQQFADELDDERAADLNADAIDWGESVGHRD